MLIVVHPKLPMRNKEDTLAFYTKLGFETCGDYPDYLMMSREGVELHFFEFKTLNPLENYGQVYIRVKNIDEFYNELLENKVSIHPNGALENKPWQQREFSILDTDNNLLTFGESI